MISFVAGVVHGSEVTAFVNQAGFAFVGHDGQVAVFIGELGHVADFNDVFIRSMVFFYQCLAGSREAHITSRRYADLQISVGGLQYDVRFGLGAVFPAVYVA